MGLYIKTKFSYRIRNDLSVFIPHVFESLFCDISLHNTFNATIGVIYRPNTPPITDLDMYLQTLQNILIQLNSGNKTVYIMGDFNIDLLKLKKNRSHTATYRLIRVGGGRGGGA